MGERMRRKKDLDILRKNLLAKDMSWGELLNLTEWSPSVLKGRLDYLEKLGELVTTSGKQSGRRTTLYGLANVELSQAETCRYGAIEFVESIQEPLSVEVSSKDGKSTVSVFATNVEEQYREGMKKMLQIYAKSWFPMWKKTKALKPGQKIAVVLTKEH
jgi:hypothetical protein